MQELQSVKTASERETAAAAEAREQAGTLAAALADLQPKLTAARAAVAQQKEKRRLTIERRSQVRAAAAWLLTSRLCRGIIQHSASARTRARVQMRYVLQMKRALSNADILPLFFPFIKSC